MRRRHHRHRQLQQQYQHLLGQVLPAWGNVACLWGCWQGLGAAGGAESRERARTELTALR